MKDDLKFATFICIMAIPFYGLSKVFWTLIVAIICADITGITAAVALYTTAFLIASIVEGPIKAWKCINPISCYV